MNRKTKNFLFLSIAGLFLTASLVFASSLQTNSKFVGGGAINDPYSVRLERSVTAAEISSGSAIFKTRNNSNISFEFDSSKSSTNASGLITLASGGVFYNSTRLTGITKIEGAITGGSAKLYYGNDPSLLNVGNTTLDTSGNPFSINLSNPSDYFRISDVTGPLNIDSLVIIFDCANSYSYLIDKENSSGDLFYLSTLEQSFSSAYTLNRNCYDVVNSSSGYSFHLTISSTASGWPTWNFNLGSTIGSTNYDIEFYAKGVGHTSYNFMLLDTNNTNILNGNRTFDVSDTWQKFTLSNLTVASGKSLADVQKVKLSVNYGSSAGSERHLFLDQLKFLIPESPSRNNIEMCDYVRASTSQTAAASNMFDVIHGSSLTSKKLTFADTTGLTSTETGTYRVFAQFDIAANLGNDNGIDIKNCTLSFDIKFSDEIANSSDSNKSRVTIDFTDSSGKASSSWFQMSGITSYGDGWYRYYRNLNGIGAISALSGNVGTIKLGFNGVYTGNQATAHIYLDNIALTAN